jgi:carbon storage regulator
VLTRRRNQSIVIGDQIVVTVLEVKNDQIRLGITAPRDVQVYRQELLSERNPSTTASKIGESDPEAQP